MRRILKKKKLPPQFNNMTKQENQFNLLDGTFTATDAKEILVTLFNDKIRFHRLRNFSHEERLGMPDPHAIDRVPKLKQTLEDILGLLKQQDGDALFEIHADIIITPIKG